MLYEYGKWYNWDDLIQKKVDPPFKPTIVPDETFHFDSTFTSKTPKGNYSEHYRPCSLAPPNL